MAIKASTRRIEGFVREVVGELPERIQQQRPLVRAAELAIRLMERRTRAGIDRHGRIFRYYRPSTARRKGRKSPVTLQDTGGRPLPGRARAHDRGYWGRGRRVDVRPASAEAKRLWELHLKGTRRMASRDFLGLTPQEEQAILRQEVEPAIRRAIPKDRRRRIQLTLMDA